MTETPELNFTRAERFFNSIAPHRIVDFTPSERELHKERQKWALEQDTKIWEIIRDAEEGAGTYHTFDHWGKVYEFNGREFVNWYRSQHYATRFELGYGTAAAALVATGLGLAAGIPEAAIGGSALVGASQLKKRRICRLEWTEGGDMNVTLYHSVLRGLPNYAGEITGLLEDSELFDVKVRYRPRLV